MPKSRSQFAPVSPPPTPRLALSIGEAFYYKLKRHGEGPREMKVGARTLISVEAAAEWRRAREASRSAEASDPPDPVKGVR